MIAKEMRVATGTAAVEEFLGVQCACGPLHDIIFTTLATLDSSHDTIRHTLLVLTDSRQGHREHRACAPN